VVAKIVPTARLRPGKCVLSGDTQGPFLDTGNNLPRYGQVYISIKWLKPALVDSGIILEEDGTELKAKLEALESERAKLLEEVEEYRNLISVIEPHLPKPPTEVVERKVIHLRAPTDEEIEKWIAENGATHHVVRNAQAPEKGSSEEWQKLYNTKKDKPVTDDDLEQLSQELSKELEPSGPTKVVELFGQQLDLDKILSENTKTIADFCQEKPDSFIEALVRREFYLAEVKSKDPRKGVLEPLGFWDNEGPLYPEDE